MVADTGGGVPLVLVSSISAGALGGVDDLDVPRTDFTEIARTLGGEILSPTRLPGPIGALEHHTRRLGYWRLALRARQSRPSLIVSCAEKIGMCVSLVSQRGTGHVVIAHNLTTPKRRAFQSRTTWLQKTDRVVVVSRPQEAYLRDEVGLEDSRVRFVHAAVDHRFYAPRGGAEEGYVLSVGQAGRDFGTLFAAVRRTSTPTVVVGTSVWMPGEDPALSSVPTNVTLRRRLSYVGLRELYEKASVVVVSLKPGLGWAAGVTAVLEAMAMRKPLIVSSTPGIAEYVTHGANALVVPPGDRPALEAAITTLLSDRVTASRLASAGRSLVESGRTLDHYVANVTGIASELLA
ncbi:MAG TPA: glycosyltransferase family 4 protein [Acidimicrobiales bacterium]|nr:glycosyltransferase family 4 protein [Acidimicrobiales bacterium]